MVGRLVKNVAHAAEKREGRFSSHLVERTKSKGALQANFKRLGCTLRTGILLVAFFGALAQAAEVEVKSTLEADSDVTVVTPGRGVRFADGTRQVTAKPGYKRTVVAYGKGTASENGTALLAALAAVTDASADNPWLLKLEPGVYDLGSNPLEMKAHVDIEGAGETATRITGNFDHATQGVVCVAPDTDLRMLTVENTGGGATAIAVSTFDVITSLVRVRAIASGASVNIGVLNDQSLSMFSQVAAEASGGTAAYAFKNIDSSPFFSDVTAIAAGATTTCAVCNTSSDTLMRDVTATASGGTTNTAVINDFSYAQMERVTAVATGGTRAVAVYSGKGALADMSDLTATATLATDVNTAIETRESSVVMRRVQAEAKGSGTCHGILNADAAGVTMYHVNIRASEGTHCYGIHNDDSPLELHAVTAKAVASAPSNGYGLFVLGESYFVGLDNCLLAGTGWSVHKVADVVVRMGASLLDGPVNEVEQYQCAECFDQTATPLTDECQPFQ